MSSSVSLTWFLADSLSLPRTNERSFPFLDHTFLRLLQNAPLAVDAFHPNAREWYDSGLSCAKVMAG